MARARRHREHERGQILILFTLVIVVLMIFASLVIDIGLLRNDRQKIVNTMDASALAGGVLMPVDGSVTGAEAQVETVVNASVTANYPGLTAGDYTISYRCLIGVDANNNPYINRDVPTVCDPEDSLGHFPAYSDFVGAGPTRTSTCDPKFHTDKCNVVVVQGSGHTQYSFGRIVGLNSGWTGFAQASSCRGPCGASSGVPVDVVMIIDRTGSMGGDGTGTQIANLKNGAAAVLAVLDPRIQRVAFGTTGPSLTNGGNQTLTNPCPSGNPGSPSTSPWVNTPVFGVGQGNTPAPGINVFDTTDPVQVGQWIPVFFTGLDNASPAVTNRQAYSTVIGGVSFPNLNSTLMKAISCVISFTSGTNLDTPIAMAQKFLTDHGRPGVTKGIILETDGAPETGAWGTTTPVNHYTCASASASAAAAKAAGIEIYTIGFLDPGTPPTCSDSSWHPAGSPASANKVTDLLANMATSSDNNGCVAAENTDNDHFFCQPKTDDLTQSFKSAALALTGGKSKLIQLYPLPYVSSVAPSVVLGGGGTVTITGQYLTGAFSVKFGGANALSFTINSDSSITAVAPGGPSGTTVDVTVTTGGGTSPIVGGDRVTWF